MIYRFLFISILCAWFLSCTKDDTDAHNTKYIDPAFSIKEVQQGDTLEIYGKTTLHLDIGWQTPRISYTFTLDNKTTSIWYEGTYVIEPGNMDNKYHTLVVMPIISQANWSQEGIADNNQNKRDTVYMISPSKRELKYVLKYVSVESKGNTLKKGKTTDDYLCLSWENPKLKDAPVSHYEVLSKDWYKDELIATLDANKTDFIDSTYVCGKKEYVLKTYFLNNVIEPWEESVVEETPYFTSSDITVEELLGQKIKISWTKPQYRARYKVTFYITDSYGEHIEKYLEYQDNYFITDAPAFPNSRYVQLSYNTATQDQLSCGQLTRTYSSATVMRVRSDYDLQATAMFAYNRGNRSIYVIRSSNMDQRDLSLNIIKSVYDNHLHYLYSDKVTCSYDGSRIAVFKNSNSSNSWLFGIVILNQDMTVFSNFNLPGNIYSQIAHPKAHNACICIDDHNRVILSAEDNIHVFSTTDGSLIYSEVMPTSPYYCKYVFSDDGKYICQYSTRHLKIFEIGETELVQKLSKDYSMLNKCIFDPINPENIYIDNDRQTQRLSVIDGSVNSSIVKGGLECIDPVTGNVAYRDQAEDGRKILYVTSNDLRNEIVHFNIAYEYDITYPHPARKLSLYNNMLFAPGSSKILYTDILKYRE